MPFPRRHLYLHTQDSQDFNINVEDLDILPEPDSKEELEDPSLTGMVFEREVKKMSGAMDKLSNMLNNIDSDKEDNDEKD